MKIFHIKHEKYTIELNAQGGSSILGRFIRLITFPFKWVFTGKAGL